MSQDQRPAVEQDLLDAYAEGFVQALHRITTDQIHAPDRHRLEMTITVSLPRENVADLVGERRTAQLMEHEEDHRRDAADT